MRVISLDDLEAELIELDRAKERSDDALREGFNTFRMDPGPDCPPDPYSQEYRDWQMNLYCRIADTPSYRLSDERTLIPNIQDAVHVPFPYYTQSPHTVGDQLMAIGFIIKTMNLAPGSRILEFGPGWGNTTINLIRMGYSVTAIDIEPNFVEIIKGRATSVSRPVDARVGSFGPVHGAEPFDAVLFFECFHHCDDHLQLIRQFDQMTHDKSVIAFAAEPILEDFHAPWGVRLDGMALWGIRNFKWMELGFRESYFVRTMMKAGWTISKHVCSCTTLGVIFLARKSAGEYLPADLFLPVDEERSWAQRETDPAMHFRCTAGTGVLTLDENERWQSATVHVGNIAPFSLDVTLECGSERATLPDLQPGANAEISLRLPQSNRSLKIVSRAWCPRDLGINEDNRTLGVAVRLIRLNPH